MTVEKIAVPEEGSDDEDEIGKLLEEEGFMSDVGLLDSLTGKPTEEDTLHFAIPVVAPFSAVRDYKVNLLAAGFKIVRSHFLNGPITKREEVMLYSN